MFFIGKADSQEDAPFSIPPFMSCCDSGVISPKSSSGMFLRFSLVVFYFSCVWYTAGLRVVVKIELLSIDFAC